MKTMSALGGFDIWEFIIKWLFNSTDRLQLLILTIGWREIHEHINQIAKRELTEGIYLHIWRPVGNYLHIWLHEGERNQEAKERYENLKVEMTSTPWDDIVQKMDSEFQHDKLKNPDYRKFVIRRYLTLMELLLREPEEEFSNEEALDTINENIWILIASGSTSSALIDDTMERKRIMRNLLWEGLIQLFLQILYSDKLALSKAEILDILVFMSSDNICKDAMLHSGVKAGMEEMIRGFIKNDNGDVLGKFMNNADYLESYNTLVEVLGGKSLEETIQEISMMSES